MGKAQLSRTHFTNIKMLCVSLVHVLYKDLSFVLFLFIGI